MIKLRFSIAAAEYKKYPFYKSVLLLPRHNFFSSEMAPLLNACMSLSKRRLKPKLIFTVFVLVLDLGPTLLVLQNVLPCDARISLWLVYARHTFLFRCCVVVRYRKRLQARDELLALPCCTFNGNGQGRVILTGEGAVVSGLGEVQCEVCVAC